MSHWYTCITICMVSCREDTHSPWQTPCSHRASKSKHLQITKVVSAKEMLYYIALHYFTADNAIAPSRWSFKIQSCIFRSSISSAPSYTVNIRESEALISIFSLSTSAPFGNSLVANERDGRKNCHWDRYITTLEPARERKKQQRTSSVLGYRITGPPFLRIAFIMLTVG